MSSDSNQRRRAAGAAGPQLAPPQSALERLPEEWTDRLAEWGEPRYRALQVFRWIHQRGVVDPARMSDLPKALRERLTPELQSPLAVCEVRASIDGTHKLVLELHDKLRVESVLIPRGSVAEADELYAPRPQAADEPAAPGEAQPALPPVTQCISSQVGCAMACVFCASGIAGLKRNLTAGEIIGQVLAGRERLSSGGDADHPAMPGRLAGVVLMGMGEPLHNYDAVARALVLLSHPEGIGMSLRRVTLSTSGLVDGIDRLGRDFGGQVALAVSVHASNDATRTRIMPINQRHPLDQLLAALRRYPLGARRSLTIEYTLIAGVNDSTDDARALARKLRGLRVKVNLIPMNPVSDTELRAPSAAAVDVFQRALVAEGLDVFVRRQRGDDIAAACGQLALKGERRKNRRAFGAIG
jgi:23S rRNA (adenine2503-C2)-methyltransferase